MESAIKNVLGAFNLPKWLMRITLLEAAITPRDYNFLQHALWACQDQNHYIVDTTGPIILGSHLYETKEELMVLFRMCRKYLYDMLVPAAIFPNLEDVLLIQAASAQTQRTLVWDQIKARQWLRVHGEKINHWLIDDIFVLCCIGLLVKHKVMRREEMQDWFLDGSPSRCAYELMELLRDKSADTKAILRPVAEQFGGGRWKAAVNASNRAIGHPCYDMRAFAAAGLDLVEFLPLPGQDGKTPRFGEIHDPIHQGGIAYFKV